MYLVYFLNIDILPDILNNDILPRIGNEESTKFPIREKYKIFIHFSYPNRGNKTNSGWGELLW